MILPFPVSDDSYAQWSLTIFRLFNEMYHERLPEKVGKIVDDFLMGKDQFDRNIGIANITSKLKVYLGIIG